MTARELIAKLQEVDPDSVVLFNDSSNNYPEVNHVEADEDDCGPFVMLGVEF